MRIHMTPWDELKVPDFDYTIRYVNAPGAVTLCWGKGIHGQCLFIVLLEGDHTDQFKKNASDVNGIHVDLRQLSEPETQGLILTLEQNVNRDLFFSLCQTLITSLEGVPDPSSALGIVFNHIKRWKAFMAGKRNHILSAEEVRGLFAELCFMRVLKTEHLTEAQAVGAWYGPDRSHQDFIFGDTAVEIKSIGGRDRNVVRISSEDQLESVATNLFLFVVRLVECTEAAQSQSLNELVTIVGQELGEADIIEEYWRKLAAYGYIEMREYDFPKFKLGGMTTYSVLDDFPRIVRSGLPNGVTDVRYNLQLEKIAPFECYQNDIWKS